MGDVGAIVGGKMSADASRDAAKSQAAATVQAAQLAAQSQSNSLDFEKSVWNTDQTNNAPYLAAGDKALSQLTAGTAQGGEFNSPLATRCLRKIPVMLSGCSKGNSRSNARKRPEAA